MVTYDLLLRRTLPVVIFCFSLSEVDRAIATDFLSAESLAESSF